MKYFILSLFIISSVFAKSVNEPMTVVQVNWSKDKKMFRLTMLKQAAVYWASKKLESCILESLNTQKDFEMDFNTQDLKISNCKKIVVREDTK
jgi:uncharacterized protein YihD (DUF1040 family)